MHNRWLQAPQATGQLLKAGALLLNRLGNPEVLVGFRVRSFRFDGPEGNSCISDCRLGGSASRSVTSMVSKDNFDAST